MSNKHKAGRPRSSFAPEYVTDIAKQTLIAFYNIHPEILSQRWVEDPDFGSTIPTQAKQHESMVRKVLTAHQQVPKEYPDNVDDICLLVYIADLDGEDTKQLQERLAKHEDIYRKRAELYRGRVINILQAKTRVDRKDFMFLDTMSLGANDEDDEF